MARAPRILVVDDEEKICRLLDRLLTQEGYEVDSRRDGESAFRAIIEHRPDLVITDLKMPGMDGLTLARRARSLDADLPVVLITGYASMETAVAALREGVSDYITKPFSIAELTGVVGRILANRVLAAENRRLLRELKVANAELTQHRQRLTVKVREAEDDLVAANRALERRLGEMEVIHEISQMIATVFELPELLSLTTQLIRDKVGVAAAAVFLLDAEESHLVAHGVRGLAHGVIEGHRAPRYEGIAGAALESPEPIFLADVTEDSRPTVMERRTFGEGSLLALSIPGKEHPAGVLMASRVDGKDPLTEEDQRLLSLVRNDLSVAIANARLFAENERNYIDILAALVNSMEARDPYLRQHSERVRMKARVVAKALSLTDYEIDVLETGARLHDLGKVGIPDRILHKPGPLTDEEMEVMRSHPAIGDRIVMPLGKLGAVKPIIRHHHERWDCAGYPDGLAGEEITLLTQIVTVVDAFDALTSNRSYRPALPREEALNIIEAAAGTQFSPFVSEVFLEIERERLVRHGRAPAQREAS